ncbi:MAG: hypothetical protein ACFUZC_14885 [Chthoniobacteraceae bacterium]
MPEGCGRICSVDYDDNILLHATLENLPDRATGWLSHAAVCLWLYASQKDFALEISRAQWIGGYLQIDATVQTTDQKHLRAVRRILQTATNATRLFPADKKAIQPLGVELLRTKPAFLGTYIDPEIRDGIASHLARLGLALAATDPDAVRVEITGVWGTLGGHGPVVLEVALHGREAKAREMLANAVFEADKAARLAGFPGISWRSI